MGDLNAKHNRVVWIDVPVADLARANAFYAAVLDCPIHVEKFEDIEFSVSPFDIVRVLFPEPWQDLRRFGRVLSSLCGANG